MNWNDVVSKIVNASRTYDKKSPDHKFIKLVEETGELAQAYLISKNSSGSGHRNKDDYSVVEEMADCLICLLSLMEILEINEADLMDFVDIKVAKWVAKLSKEQASNVGPT